MRALITGGSGFVGAHLSKHLRDSGDDVVTTDRATGGPDLLDQRRVAALIADVRPDVVFHLGGQADVDAAWRDPVSTFRINAEGTLNVCLAARAAAVGRVLVVTSAEVYGVVKASDLPIRETAPLAPANPYAASKAAAEMICIQQSAADLDVVRVRAFNHLGPGQTSRFVAPALAERVLDAIANGDGQISVGRLDTRRDFTDVRDVVRAYRLLATRAEPGEAYNVCSGVDRSISEIADAIIEELGATVQLIPDPALSRPAEVPVLVGCASKIESQTGWKPKIPLQRTIAELIALMRSERQRN